MEETPEIEKKVIGLRIERALIPDWYNIVLDVCANWCIRMYTIEKPEEYVVQIEFEVSKVAPFYAALALAWDAFVEAQKSSGNWEQSESIEE